MRFIITNIRPTNYLKIFAICCFFGVSKTRTTYFLTYVCMCKCALTGAYSKAVHTANKLFTNCYLQEAINATYVVE